MAYQMVFKRYELKYLLTQEQKQKILEAMAPHMALDNYGRTTIRNIYFDTDNYRLARHSIEKPVYKEKLRIRSYEQAGPGSTVFVELKKKYDSVVYKRRITLTEQEAVNWIRGGTHLETEIPTKTGTQTGAVTQSGADAQIAREIEYFLTYYESLHPVVFLSYEREAYYSCTGDDFRVTFDDHILCRQEDLSLEADVGGVPLLEEGKVLMEIKCSGGIPLWMTQVLSRECIYKTSFSKYGTAYQTIIYSKYKGGYLYA